ncbi:hypothetical protein PanWU01x14_187250 [Parasponia andersonii]|uniref:Uncharacterized protein n=1 Tax=Parasponia andersonii TaxID=3476 RepID=A0A2P5C3F1_PARAD|nr:hypothetical protein PanWU01x14_187250 [Parasponia andersonii]
MIGWNLLKLFLVRRLPIEATSELVVVPIVDLISLDCSGEVVLRSEPSANKIRADVDVVDRVKDSFEDDNDATLDHKLPWLSLLPIRLDSPQPDLSSLARVLASYDGSRPILDILSVTSRFEAPKYKWSNGREARLLLGLRLATRWSVGLIRLGH